MFLALYCAALAHHIDVVAGLGMAALAGTAVLAIGALSPLTALIVFSVLGPLQVRAGVAR